MRDISPVMLTYELQQAVGKTRWKSAPLTITTIRLRRMIEMKIPRSAVIAVVEYVDMGFRSAVKYLNKDTVVKCTARFRPRANARQVDMVLTMGRPNYAERKFIKSCIAAGEKFPVRKVQLKSWPVKT